ncbi:MAG: glycoside hydrolase family 13 protein [Oscillospiraceae bacterium]|jgi:glycosidase|nr:glycoside hydrolase family 13 protein [Oscillospiraceae bacterium]
MEDILFDSRSALDRLPLGAITAGTQLRLGLRAAETLGITGLRLVVIDDTDGSAAETALSPVWTEGGYTRYEGAAVFDKTGLYWYFFRAVIDGADRAIGKTPSGAGFAGGEPRAWQLTVYAPDYTTPEWIKRGAFYHIFVDRFKKGGAHPVKNSAVARRDWGGLPVYLPDAGGEIRNSDFFGGDLDGVIEKLPYLHELGISCIYLSPIFEAASNHKYDTGDYAKIDPAFGDEATFSRLCAEAGRLGIRVLCDGVFNHTGSDSRYFNREGGYGPGGAYRDKGSPYYKWYDFTEWPDKYDAWWGITTLPQVKKDCLDFHTFICGDGGILEKWLSFGASGWRLDVADELSEDFLEALRRTVKGCDPEALIIGEVWEDASNKTAYGSRRHYFLGKELDGVMNYPLRDAIIAFIKTREASGLRETVESLCENYPPPALGCLMNILGTHDTKRILTELSGTDYGTRKERANARLSPDARTRAKRLLRLASLLQFTLPGVPSIYYGDEAGLEGFEDPFNRRCYPWGSADGALTEWYKALLAMRRSTAVFAGGEYRTLTAEDGVFAFTRGGSGGKAKIYVNLSGRELALALSPGERKLLLFNGTQNASGLRILDEGCAVTETAAEA